MAIHLIKLCVGPASLAELEAWQAGRQELMHITRNTPKRADELLDGGSLYWIIKGWICARQKLLELRPLVIDGVPHCGLALAPELVRVVPRQFRPFQGWRYLKPEDAPQDLPQGKGIDGMPEEMVKELARLGLM